MAKTEYRKPINALMQEKEKLQAQMNTVNDEFNVQSEALMKLRGEETSYRQSLEALPKSATHVPARNVFDRMLGEVRGKIQEVSKLIEAADKRKATLQSQITSLSNSIRELDRGV